MKKRISAALLSVVLCLALLSTSALGAGASGSVTIKAEAGKTTATITATSLQANTVYNMCTVSRGGELLALFNATTDDSGAFTTQVDVGKLMTNQTLRVYIPAASGGTPTTGTGSVEQGSASSTTFTITASAGSGGSISPSGSVTVTKDGSQTFTITPDSSYSISDVTVDGSSVGAQSSYTFPKVTSNHTIHATFTYNGGGSGDNPGGGGGSGGGGGGGGGGGSSSTNSPKIEKNTGGTVKVSSDGKTVTITPKDGYRIKDVIINGESVGAVTKYVFDKASSKNTVEVIFEKIPDSETPGTTTPSFHDVTGHWAASAINFVVEKGLFNGTSATTFSPNAPMTRSMLATVLYRLAGEPAASGGSSFADVQSGQWYSNAVAWAAQNGIVTGTGTGFSPNGNITREQLATMLYRFCAYAKGDTSVSKPLNFPDAGNVSNWASEAMQWAVGAGIISGTDTGALNPGGFATRAEVATMLMRFVNFLG